jgi:Tfp pilus assembly protein PilX
MPADAVESFLPLGLAFGLTFLAVIAITIAVSMAVCLKVRKITFRMQSNSAYQETTITSGQDIAMASLEDLESTISYAYPMADNGGSAGSNTAIITEWNKAYGTRIVTLCSKGYDNPLRNLELTYAEIDIVDGGAGASNSSSRKDQGGQSEATSTAGIAKSDNESMTGSGTAEEYDYIQN